MRKFYSAKNQTKILRQIRSQQKTLNSMVETKSAQWKSYPNTSLPQNNTYVVKTDVLQTVQLNPFYTATGTSAPDQIGGSRIGDQISVKGMKICAFFENALNRPKVYYRMMLVRMAKGDTISRDTLFQGDSDNKMIDVVNTERFTIVAQKRFNVYAQGSWAAGGVNASGEPEVENGGGLGTKIVNMWIPGRKFGKYGKVTYENGSTSQVKFFDYRLVILAYDWYGTPQDINNVGKLNELYTKVYFKDA